jgi:hypothetical protein
MSALSNQNGPSEPINVVDVHLANRAGKSGAFWRDLELSGLFRS